MATPIGTLLFRRLITEKAGVDAATAGKVLDAQFTVLMSLLEAGAVVRVFPSVTVRQGVKKATRRRMPGSPELIDIPAKPRLEFKESR